MKLKLNPTFTKVLNTLTLKSTQEIKICNSLDELKILTFWDIVRNKNVYLLDVDYKDGKTYTEEQTAELSNTWLKLYDDYYILTNDSKSKIKMDKTFNELKLRDKIMQVKNNYDFLVYLSDYKGVISDEDFAKYEQDCYNNLKKIDKKLKPKLFAGILENLKYLDKIMSSLINKYNIEHKNNKEQVDKEINNVYDVVANAESWLERNLEIEKMVVTRWIAYEKQIKDKQKAQQKNGK